MKTVCAKMVARPHKTGELKEVLNSFFDRVLDEKGTRYYALHEDPQHPNTFFFYEQYTDEAARQLHLESEYLRQAGEKMKPLLAEEPVIEQYDLVQWSDMSKKPPETAYGADTEGVWARTDLRNQQKNYCMCWQCARFKPKQEDKGCAIIRQVLQLAQQQRVVLPVSSCTHFVPV